MEFHHREVALRRRWSSPTYAKMRAAVEEFAPEGRVVVLHVGRYGRQAVLAPRHHRLQRCRPAQAPRGLRLPGPLHGVDERVPVEALRLASASSTASCARPREDRMRRTWRTDRGPRPSTRRSPPRTTGIPSSSASSATRCGGAEPGPRRAGGARSYADGPTARRSRYCGTLERAQPGHRVRRTALGRRDASRGAVRGVRELRRPAALRLRARRPGRAAPPVDPRVPGGRRTALGGTAVASRAGRSVVRAGGVGRGAEPTDVRRVVAAVPLDGSAVQDRDAVRELTDGSHRFVTGPRLSPDGAQAAWLAWDHPRHTLGRHRTDPRRRHRARHPARRAARRGRTGGVDRPGGLDPRRHPPVHQ